MIGTSVIGTSVTYVHLWRTTDKSGPFVRRSCFWLVVRDPRAKLLRHPGRHTQSGRNESVVNPAAHQMNDAVRCLVGESSIPELWQIMQNRTEIEE